MDNHIPKFSLNELIKNDDKSLNVLANALSNHGFFIIKDHKKDSRGGGSCKVSILDEEGKEQPLIIETPYVRSFMGVYKSDDEKQTATSVINELKSYYQDPIVTEVSPLINYFEAEDYHQNYYELNKSQSYCAAVITPKLTKLRKLYADKLK